MNTNYPDKPQTDRFFDGYGYQTIKRLISWEYSVTFGKWGATVEFSDGKTMYTYPEHKQSDPTYGPLTLEQAKELTSGKILYSLTSFNKQGQPHKWKVNGKPQLWKRDSQRVRVPVKHGLYAFGQLTEEYLHQVSLSEQYAKDQRKVSN